MRTVFNSLNRKHYHWEIPYITPFYCCPFLIGLSMVRGIYLDFKIILKALLNLYVDCKNHFGFRNNRQLSIMKYSIY